MKLVKDIMTPHPQCIEPDTPLHKAAEAMRQHSIGCLPVLEGARLVGMLTDRDIVLRAVAAGKDPARMTAREAMTNKPVAITAESTAAEAADVMKQRSVRRLVAVDRGGKPLGVLSMGDIAACRDDQETAEAGAGVLASVCCAGGRSSRKS